MDLGQLKNNISLGTTAELHQFFDDCIIIKVSKSFGNKLSFYFYTGAFIKVIIIAKIVFVKKKIYLFTTIAAKHLIIGKDCLIAGFTAMIAGCFYGGCMYYIFNSFVTCQIMRY